MKTGWVCHELYMWHNTQNWNFLFEPGLTMQPGEHAENPETKRRFRNLVEVSGLLTHLHPIAPRRATVAEVQRFHTPDYVAHIREMSDAGGGEAGRLVPIGRGSYEIALLAAGGVIEAIDAVVAGTVDNAYILCRPPGHHAEAGEAKGFCVFGNAAIGIMHARDVHGLTRIASVDWDVHHGNGTESAFYDDPNTLTISLHQDRLFPRDSGDMSDTGRGAGKGANINIPLPPGSGRGAYIKAMEDVVLPALERFQPELIVIPSGFDASAMDPLGHMMLSSVTYRRLTAMLMESAGCLCGGKLVATHEGGYSAAYVPYCGLAVLETLSGVDTGIDDPFSAHIELYGGQDILPHQAEVIAKAAELVGKIPI